MVKMLTFGSYPHTATGTDRTPIRWHVLQNTGTEVFLLSALILDCKPYHREYVNTTWQDCDLRAWLNHEFYDIAFNSDEKRRIQTAYCDDNGDGSPDTKDKVFLLSATEIKRLTTQHDEDSLGVTRRAVGTEFATAKKADGCRLYVYNLGVKADYLTAEDGIEKGCSWWWLRTQLGDSSRAAFVGPRSSIRSYCRVNRVTYGVRPALKIALLGSGTDTPKSP